MKEGPVKIGANSSKLDDCYLFLFNDLFLVTKKRTGGLLKKEGFELRGKVALDESEARIVNIADTEGKPKKIRKNSKLSFSIKIFKMHLKFQ